MAEICLRICSCFEVCCFAHIGVVWDLKDLSKFKKILLVSSCQPAKKSAGRRLAIDDLDTKNCVRSVFENCRQKELLQV